MVTVEQLALAARNHGMPLEALRYPVTPIGLHYVLLHYDIPYVDAASWRLAVDGLVRRPLSLTFDDITGLPTVELVTTMECAGNGRARLEPPVLSQPWLDEAVGTGRWRGVRLATVLERAGVTEEAVEIVFAGLDRGIEGGEEQEYARSLPVAAATDGDALLVFELDGRPLPPQHGFPLRLIVPGWYGMTNVKWLARISAVDEPFTGHQQVGSYVVRMNEDDEGIPLTRMLPRALMVPPGTPDFPTRARTLAAGPQLLAGRAWSGWGPIDAVQVSVDGGRTWAPAELERDVASPWAWTRWSFSWDARAGEQELACRAIDAVGNEQPLEPAWNVGGYANNAVQRILVTVV